MGERFKKKELATYGCVFAKRNKKIYFRIVAEFGTESH